MQILNAGSWSNLTIAQVQSILTGNQITYTPGLELLDGNNNLVSDISNYLVSGEVDRNNTLLNQGTCKLRIERALSWGKDRVRPYMIASNGTISARFNLGVFVLTTPDVVLGETPVCYDVTGYDLIFLLLNSVSDTVYITAGTSYITAVQSLLTSSGVGGTVAIDGTLSASVLPADMAWVLDPTTATTWISVINTLLASINYVPLWVDQDGVFHSSPNIPPANSAVEWLFDTNNSSTNIVLPQRTLTSDVWAAKNWWRFVRKGMTTQPTEGSGMYTVQNTSTGRTSQSALGRTIKAPVQFLDASNQASLVAQGDAIIVLDQAVSRTFKISVDALPCAGNNDIVQYTDSGGSDKCRVVSWAIPLDGSAGSWVLESVAI